VQLVSSQARYNSDFPNPDKPRPLGRGTNTKDLMMYKYHKKIHAKLSPSKDNGSFKDLENF